MPNQVYIRLKNTPLIFALAVSFTAFSQQSNNIAYKLTDTQAKALVQKVLATDPVIDGHNDVFVQYMDCKTCPRDLGDYRIDTINSGHTDIMRLRKGGASGILINVFGHDKTATTYLNAWDLLYRMEASFPKDFKIVGSSMEMSNAMKQGKIALLPILEGAIR